MEYAKQFLNVGDFQSGMYSIAAGVVAVSEMFWLVAEEDLVCLSFFPAILLTDTDLVGCLQVFKRLQTQELSFLCKFKVPAV